MAPIRQRLYNIGEATRITHQYAHTPSFYRRHGYCLFRNVLSNQPDPNRFLARIRDEFDNNSESFGIVVNDKPVRRTANRTRSERRQIVSEILNEDWRCEYFNEQVARHLNEIQSNVRICAQRFLPNEHELLFTETLLFSRSGSNTIQDPHADLDPIYSGTAILAFVALEPGTTLFVYPGTHRIDTSGRTQYLPQRILFDVGDIFLFHPSLLHCGDRYVESNLRLHYYIFARPRFIWANVTFPARDGTLVLMQIEENRILMQRNSVEGRQASRRRKKAATSYFMRHVRSKRYDE